MKNSAASIANYSFLFLLLFLNFWFLNFTIEPKLHYHAQHLSFVFSSDFFHQHLLLPGLLSEYIASFMSQLFYYNFYGSLFIIFLAILIFYTSLQIMKIFNKEQIGFFISLLPVAFIVPLFANYYFPLVISLNVLFIYSYTLLYIYLTYKNINMYISYIILALVLYYLCGSGVFMIFSASSIILTYFFKGLKTSLIFSIAVIAFTFIFPFAAYKMIFNISLSSAYFSIIPDLPVSIKYEPGKILYIFYFFLPFSLLVVSLISVFFSPIPSAEKKINRFASFKNLGFLIISLIIIASLNFFLIRKSFNIQKKNVVLASYYNNNEDWAKVKEVVFSNSSYDVYLNYYYNRAILNSGEFLEEFFGYPQLIGGDGLYADRVQTISIVMISSDYYYDLGYITQAHHWAHEAQTSLPNSPVILKRLVKTNLIMGNYTAAGNLLQVLNDIPYCNEFVDKYYKYIKDTTLAGKDPEIKEKRYLMPENTLVVDNFPQRMYDLLENRYNKKAYDNLQLYFLLTHRVGNFIKHLPEGSKYHKTIPYTFEEAVALYSSKTNQLNTNIKISELSEKRIRGFQEIITKYKGDKVAARDELYNLYGNTYLYYIVYNSPLVTKAEIKAKN